MRPIPRRLWFSILLLLTGIAIYLFFRPQDLLNGFLDFRISTRGLPQVFHQVINSLPDALWYGALLVLQPPYRIWRKNRLSAILVIIAIMLPWIHEFMQAINIVPGVFSIDDIVAYLIVLLIYLTSCLHLQLKKQSFWCK